MISERYGSLTVSGTPHPMPAPPPSGSLRVTTFCVNRSLLNASFVRDSTSKHTSHETPKMGTFVEHLLSSFGLTFLRPRLETPSKLLSESAGVPLETSPDREVSTGWDFVPTDRRGGVGLLSDLLHKWTLPRTRTRSIRQKSTPFKVSNSRWQWREDVLTGAVVWYRRFCHGERLWFYLCVFRKLPETQ